VLVVVVVVVVVVIVVVVVVVVVCGINWQASELEPVEKEMNVSLQGIGLSLVNDQQRREIAYMAISRSTFVWSSF